MPPSHYQKWYASCHFLSLSAINQWKWWNGNVNRMDYSTISSSAKHTHPDQSCSCCKVRHSGESGLIYFQLRSKKMLQNYYTCVRSHGITQANTLVYGTIMYHLFGKTTYNFLGLNMFHLDTSTQRLFGDQGWELHHNKPPWREFLLGILCIPWAPQTKRNKGVGHLKTRFFTINTSKNEGLGGPW